MEHRKWSLIQSRLLLGTGQHVEKLVVDEEQFSADLGVAEQARLDERVQP